VLRRLGAGHRHALGATIVATRSQVGGGAIPTVELPSAAVALGTAARPAQALDEALRQADPPVLGRVADERLLLDCRTVLAADVVPLARILASVA
jgi:L-seryl-tRNA(Ser) seleniumtransferase